jgi:iron complex outermembrane receptor protein
MTPTLSHAGARACPTLCALLLAGPALALDNALPDVVVTAVHDHSPVHVVADP